MKPILYHRILKLITKYQLKSLTFDVFDTIILNEYWPQDLRHYDLAIKQLPLIQKFISSDLTTYEILDLRRYARRLLRSKGITLRLDTWLTELVELILIKYPTNLTDDQQLELIANLIKLELEFTLENCKPNQPLLAQLQLIKQLHPDLKIYFTSHSHFTSAQIKLLLQIFQINLFDDGATLADFDKVDRELFDLLPNSFQISQNLHIGDHYHQDFLHAKHMDSHALHYRPIRLRGLRTMVGSAWIQVLQLSALCRAKRLSFNEHNQLSTELSQIYAHKISATVSLDYNNYILSAHLTHLDTSSYPNLKTFPELNRITLLRAFIWLLATFDSPRWNAPQLLSLLLQQTTLQTRTQLYNFCFTPNYIYSHLAIQSFTDDEFYQVFLSEIRNADPEFTQNLRESYEMAILALPQNDKPTTFISINNDGSAELFRDFARLHNLANDFDSLILNSFDFTPNLPKPTSTQDLHYELAPDTYLTKILQPKLQKPTKI